MTPLVSTSPPETPQDADMAAKLATFRVSKRGLWAQGVCFTLAPVCSVLTAAAVPFWVRLAAAATAAGMGGFLAFMNQSVGRRHSQEGVSDPSPATIPPPASVGPLDAPLTKDDVQAVRLPDKTTPGGTA